MASGIGMSSGAGPHDPTQGNDREATVTGLNFGADIAAGTVLAERFRIERLLGIGGMGVVYLATDLALGVPVAVKLLRLELANRPGAFERFRQELLLARQVSSPHVVRIHDIAQDGGRWLISMDAVDGESLEKLLDTRSPLPVEEALAITRQIALGLSAAHARGVIHRDLKPSNILVDANGTAYISDFGIARSLGTSGLTQTGAVVGTAEYLSPEQARAQPVDGRSDLYALGLLLYEMLAGQPAFSGGTQAESLTQRLVGPPLPIRRKRADAPAWVERLLDRLLRTNPAHRLQSADAVVQAIDQKNVPRDFRPGRRTWGIAATIALLATVAIFVWKYQHVAPAAMPMPPPNRLLLLPMDNATGDATLGVPLAAYSEQLRQSLTTLPDLVVVDSDRVDQAVAQLGLPDSRAGDVATAAILREVPATQVLRPRLEHASGGYRFSATLSQVGSADINIVATTKPDLLIAADELTRNAAQAIRPGEKFSAHLLPGKLAALARYGDGLQARRQGHIGDALGKFTEATAADPTYASAWMAQAQAAFQSANLDAAADAAEHGAQLAPPQPLRLELEQWKALANGDDLATPIAQQVARIKARPDDLDGLLKLAFLQGENGDYPEAISNLHRLLARDGNDPRASFLLGKYSILHGDLRPAVDEYLVRALVLYKRSRNIFGEAEAVNALGVGFSRLGQTAEAEEQYRKAVELRHALGDRRGEASSLRNLAQMATIQGHFDQAQAQLGQARSLFEALGDRNGLSATDNDLGLLAEERGDFTTAMEAYRRKLRSSEQAGDADGAAESLNNIGFANYQLGDYDSAQVFWQQALAAFTKLQDMNGIVRVQQNLGLLDIARGQWDESRRLLTTSLAAAERQQMVEEAAVSRRNLAELELTQGHLAKALDQLDHAKTLFVQREDQRGLIDTALLRMHVFAAANALDRAAQVRVELEPLLADGSDEQRAIAAMLQSDIAQRRNDPMAAQKAQVEAQRLALASGVRAVQLQAALLAAKPTTADVDAIAQFDNVPLRISGLERSMTQQLAAGDAKVAATSYRDAENILTAHPDSIDTFAVHWLGAQALAQTGNQAAASAARARAADSLRNLRSGLSDDLLTSFNATANVRAFEAANHGP
jgi:tetratricopeptide (TPR) repeat protein